MAAAGAAADARRQHAVRHFSERMPTVGFSMVNHDNNQHGPDENLRLGNLWEGIEMMAA